MGKQHRLVQRVYCTAQVIIRLGCRVLVRPGEQCTTEKAPAPKYALDKGRARQKSTKQAAQAGRIINCTQRQFRKVC